MHFLKIIFLISLLNILISSSIKAIKNIIDGLIDKFPILETALKPFQVIVNAIYEAFKAISDIVANFSLDKLLESLKNLRDIGNTLIVVEHDEDTMYAADQIFR